MDKIDLNNNDLVQETERSEKLVIDGISNVYSVYRIKLDCLYYNDQNDRIATWISKYESEKGPLDVNSPDYNNLIHDMIKESNLDAFNKTKKNIGIFGQRVFGVVLSDGRIIDGNRRFTCLRELSKEDPKFNYFDAVIISHSYDDANGKKIIKALELEMQHGTEKPVDYDPVNRLVGVYRDLIEDGHSFEPKEYARCINQKESDVRKSMELAKLMVDYLEFIHAPKQFYIAVNQNINGPLNEMYSILKKVTDPEEHEQYKQWMFAAMLYGEGDVTRVIRKYRKIAEDGASDIFIKEQDDIVCETIDKIDSVKEPMSQAIISEVIQSDKELRTQVKNSIERESDRVGAKSARSAPIELVDGAISKLSVIDDVQLTIVEKKDELRVKLDELLKLVKKWQECLDGESD